MTNAVLDDNRTPTLIGVSSLDLTTPTILAVNPTTGALVIDSTSLYAGLDTRYLQLTGGTETGPVAIVNNNSATGQVALSVMGASGQTGHIQDWKAYGGTLLSYIDAAGVFHVSKVNAVVTTNDVAYTFQRTNYLNGSHIMEWQDEGSNVLASVSNYGDLTAPRLYLTGFNGTGLIKVSDGTATSNPVGLNILGGNGYNPGTTQVGSSIAIQAGEGANGYSGGSVTIAGGRSEGHAIKAGSLTLQGGDGFINGNGGDVIIRGGYINGTGTASGIVNIISNTYNFSPVYAQLSTVPLTANRMFTFPDNAGTFALTSDLSSYVPTARTITATSPLTIDGGASADLSADRTVAIDTTTTAFTKYLQLTGGTLTGNVIHTPTSDSTTLLKVTNAANTNTLFNIDSSTSATNLLSANDASFETSIGSWVAKGSATVTQSATNAYYGSKSMKIVTTAAANDGATIPITLATGSKNFSFYVLLTAGSGPIVCGYAFDGADETTELSLTYTPTTTGWIRVNFTFSTVATSGTPYFFIKQTTAVAKTMYVDGVMITASAANVTPPYYEGLTAIGGPTLLTNQLIIKPTVDSNTTFAILSQNSGRMVLQVSTTGGGSGQVNIGPVTPTALIAPPPANVFNVWGLMGFLPFGSGAANTAGINFYDGFSTVQGKFIMEPNTGSGASGDMYFANLITTGGGFALLVGGATKASNTALYIDNTNRNVGIGLFTSAGTKPGAKLHVLGDADIIQEIIRANATQTSALTEWQASGGGMMLRVQGAGHLEFAGGTNIVASTTTGTKIGTGTTQLLSLWNAAPIAQPTTAIAASTFVANTSGIANDTATWDGYTIGQVVKALRNFGLLQ